MSYISLLKRTILAALVMALPALLFTGCGGAQPAANQTANPIAPPAPAGPPKLTAEAIFRPAFETSLGRVDAGTAFVVEWHGRQVVLSALHLLGTAGGLAREVAAADVPRVVTALELSPCFEGPNVQKVAVPAAAISIPSARPLGAISAGAGDVIAFWLPADANGPALKLADAAPKSGERVWLAASVMAGGTPGAQLHAAKVIEVDEAGDLLYAFDQATLELRATSGAPVLNAAGHVVAINLGGGSPNPGQLLGVGNPISRFRSSLEKAQPPR